jgi:DedD protein
MRLPLKSRDDDPAPTGADAVEIARTRARRRLIGALVLLAIGVVGFPLLFETEPRPVALDVPIVTTLRDAPPQRASTPSRRPLPVADAPVEHTRPAASAPAATVPFQARPDVPDMAASAVGSAAMPPAAPIATTAARPGVGAAASAAAPARATAAAAAAASAPSAQGGRFVIQVGAYTDAATLREARARVEKLGLNTYTQVIENDAGRRTRVRVGPFATRDEANAAAARLKAAGLPAHLLAL